VSDSTFYMRPKGTHYGAQTLFFLAVIAACFLAVLNIEGTERFPEQIVVASTGMPLVLLAFAGLLWRHDATGVLTFFTLISAAAGDVMLLLADNTIAVAQALKVYSLTHGLYILIFLANWASAHDAGTRQTKLAGLLWATAISIGFLVWPDVDQRDPSLMAYGTMMAVMATTAMLSSFSPRLVGTGAMLFAASHAYVMAQHMAVLPPWLDTSALAKLAHFIYLLAQTGLMMGIILGPMKRK